jgi:hypothetical protein
LKRNVENFFPISFDNASNDIKFIDYFIHALNSNMNGRMLIKNIQVIFLV